MLKIIFWLLDCSQKRLLVEDRFSKGVQDLEKENLTRINLFLNIFSKQEEDHGAIRKIKASKSFERGLKKQMRRG